MCCRQVKPNIRKWRSAQAVRAYRLLQKSVQSSVAQSPQNKWRCKGGMVASQAPPHPIRECLKSIGSKYKLFCEWVAVPIKQCE